MAPARHSTDLAILPSPVRFLVRCEVDWRVDFWFTGSGQAQVLIRSQDLGRKENQWGPYSSPSLGRSRRSVRLRMRPGNGVEGCTSNFSPISAFNFSRWSGSSSLSKVF